MQPPAPTCKNLVPPDSSTARGAVIPKSAVGAVLLSVCTEGKVEKSLPECVEAQLPSPRGVYA